MSITSRQYQNLQAEALRMAEELPKGQLLATLVAPYEAGRLLHMTKSTLTGLLGSVIVRCIDAELDPGAPLAPPTPASGRASSAQPPTTTSATWRSTASTTTATPGTNPSQAAAPRHGC